jgi:glycine cleavage system H protein
LVPDLGDLISSQEGLCVVESVKSASDVHAPVDLKVLEVNESLDDEPELVNSDCYDAGWLIKFNADSIDGLMDSDAYIATLDLD